MEQPYYNLKQLKDLYDISIRGWREFIKRKDLRAFKIGRSFFISKDDLMEFIEDKEAYSWREKGTYPFSDE